MGEKRNDGCYAISAPGGDIYIETSKMRALELAVYLGGDVKFVKWGQAIADAPVLDFAPKRAKKPEPKSAQELSDMGVSG